MGTGINSVLLRLANIALEKRAQGGGFVPAPAMGGDPSMQGGGAPAGGPMGPGVDPAMMQAAQGMDPAAIMAAQGQQVDPAMAAAGGATGMPPPGDPAAGGAGAPPPGIDPNIQAAIDAAIQKAMGGAAGGAGGKGGSGKNVMMADIAEIKSLLNKVLGVMVGSGKLPATDLGEVGSQPGEGVPAEQKVASMGAAVMSEASQERVANSLADLILSLKGGA